MIDCLEFHISESMVRRFSRLTGDLNPLHNDSEFARRTAYRKPIAQGMLIYAYTVFLTRLLRPGEICIPVHMKAQFIEPVFIDQGLTLEIDTSNMDGLSEGEALDFVVARKADGKKALKGHIQVQYGKSKPQKDNSVDEDGSICMTDDQISLKSPKIEDITVGDTENFRFSVSDGKINDFIENLYEGLKNQKRLDLTRIKREFHIPNLLSAMLLSTSVGMLCPGKFATFLDFDITLPVALPTDKRFNFSGAIRSVSASTRMIKKEVSVLAGQSGPEESLMRGHLHALINHPPAVMPDMMELRRLSDNLGMEGKVAIVTGASRGIGETIAKLLAIKGAKVAVNYYRGMHDAQRVVKEIEQFGGNAIAIGADIRNEEQVHDMIETVTKVFGRIDILVNNAVRDFKPSPFANISWTDVTADIDVIVKGAFNCCKAVLPIMISQKGGKIINMGTVATENPPANQSKYVIAKSALVGLTRALSIEYAAKNIQVNMVVPHFVATDLVAHIPAPYRQKMEREIPMKRAASVVDVAKTVAFLASSFSDFITGQKMMVTGGGAPYT